ncbi:MAG: DNA repair protein RecN, partial [Peptococcaceae bacterium]|nr:DNA repair protein RecN [Peptococcaceae bacterium]
EISLEIERLDFYPMTLDTVEDRLALIQKLKKKYGSSIEEILAYGDRIKDELAELENNELRVELMEEELSIITSKLVGESDNLTEERKKTALILEKDITKELVDLEMPGIIFNVVFTKQKNITGIGNERIEFFITTNPGEPARPMSRVASGGETSRIMLAVKTILAELEGIPTLIFDEIETGIGGQTIWSLGQKLYQLSSKMQIISVTHSSPLASLAKNHLLIAKRNIKGRTSAEVETLDFEGRLRELTRMLGGSESEESQAALEHAKALLKKTNN